ncbi:MAG: PP2C family serine/threonine-protein phosphatase [Bryobacteraceae bacterium]|nr:PP2C family serine/threonine-protein phosphatase [Bryobacteraceae bacterium]
MAFPQRLSGLQFKTRRHGSPSRAGRLDQGLDSVNRQGEAGGSWRVIGASVTGAGHQARGEPCQDAHAWDTLPDGALVAAVADGAGSCALGGQGAAIAVAAVVEAARCHSLSAWPVEEAGWKTLLSDILMRARDAVTKEAAARDRNPRDFSTTLIAVIATPDAIAAAQIGDGAAVASSEDRAAIEGLTLPILGEYLNETTFLTSPNAVETAQVRMLPQPAFGLALLSDGLQGVALKLPSGEPHAPFFLPLLRFAASSNPREGHAELAAFLGSDKISRKTDDDVTLVLAVSLR